MLTCITTAMAVFTQPAHAQSEINWNDPSFTSAIENPDGTVFIYGQDSSGDPFYETVGTPDPQKVTEFLGQLFVFLLGLVGVSAFFMISWGGFQYATSAANPGAISAAKEKIWGALFGLALAAGSVIVLQTINPDLIKFKMGIHDANAVVLIIAQSHII